MTKRPAPSRAVEPRRQAVHVVEDDRRAGLAERRSSGLAGQPTGEDADPPVPPVGVGLVGRPRRANVVERVTDERDRASVEDIREVMESVRRGLVGQIGVHRHPAVLGEVTESDPGERDRCLVGRAAGEDGERAVDKRVERRRLDQHRLVLDVARRVEGRLAALERRVTVAPEIARLEHPSEPVGVPRGVDDVRSLGSERVDEHRANAVKPGATGRDCLPERGGSGVVSPVPGERVARERVGDKPVVVEAPGVFQRLDGRPNETGVGVVFADDRLDDGAAVGVGHVDEDTVDIEDDRVGFDHADRSHGQGKSLAERLDDAGRSVTDSPRSRPGTVEGDRRQRLRLDGHRRRIATERREQTVRTDRAGDGARRAVKLRREPAGVDGVGPGVGARPVGHGSHTGDDIVADKPNGFGEPVGHVRNVGGDHVTAGGGERRRRVGTGPDPDLDEAFVARQPVEKRVRRHGGIFIPRGRLGVCMHVGIVPVGAVPAQAKREASGALRSVYDTDVTVHDEQDLPEGAFDSGRDQYQAEEFIELAGRVGTGDKNIAITTEDLYYRRRNYVFGLAYLNGKGSVISTCRLQTSSDGGISSKSAGEVFSDRVRKEVVHEIGHTFGLEHCDNERCVMSFSPTVREVDVKEEHLCGSCSREVL